MVPGRWICSILTADSDSAWKTVGVASWECLESQILKKQFFLKLIFYINFPIFWPLDAGIGYFWLEIWILRKISSLVYNLESRSKNEENYGLIRFKNWILTKFWDSRHSQLAIPTVFHAESESAVRIDRIQRPGTKI